MRANANFKILKSLLESPLVRLFFGVAIKYSREMAIYAISFESVLWFLGNCLLLSIEQHFELADLSKMLVVVIVQCQIAIIIVRKFTQSKVPTRIRF